MIQKNPSKKLLTQSKSTKKLESNSLVKSVSKK
jgi:hypothetical protein